MLFLEFVLLQEYNIEDDEGAGDVEQEPPLHGLHVGGGGDGSCDWGVQGVQNWKYYTGHIQEKKKYFLS